MVTNGKDIGFRAESNSSSLNSAAITDTASRAGVRAPSLEFSEELEEFYKSHNFYPSIDTISCYCPWRFVRLNPRYDKDETLKILQEEVKNLRNNKISEDAGAEYHSSEVTTITSVPWLESRWGFYALPAKFPLSKSLSFRSGKIYGMDVSSGAAVAALLTDHYDNNKFTKCGSQKNQFTTQEDASTRIGENLNTSRELRILDLCCSPGLKLLQIADFFHQKESIESTTGTKQLRSVKLMGVDICKHRMNVCKSIVQKYFVDFETSGRLGMEKISTEDRVNIQLYLQDGTSFGISDSPTTGNVCNLVFDSGVAIEEMFQRQGKRKRMNKSARAREKRKLRHIVKIETHPVVEESESGSENDKHTQNSIECFDYVLVDAECSTDGSFKHIKERIKDSKIGCVPREENHRLTDPNKLAELVGLQRKLIVSGFRLLKAGGTLVYSTCSLSEDQNEKVVKWLLESYQDAVLQPLCFHSKQYTKCIVEGSLKGTIRFYPNFVQGTESTPLLFGDGFFVAKIRKRPSSTLKGNTI